MQDNPTSNDVEQLLATIAEIGEIPRIAQATRCSSKFSRSVSCLIADAKQQAPRIHALDPEERQRFYQRYQHRLAEMLRQGLLMRDLEKHSQLANADLCDIEHRRIVAGKCPWFGRIVTSGTPDLC